ncbi:MAG: DUF2141 domain-containing protein [Pseudomonadota bacterium]|nr:DUF2141 domain-containing protein [Pseudomonadota bacterium]
MLSLAAGSAKGAELIITVTNIRSDEGLVRLAVFDDAKEFPEGKMVQNRDVPARAVSLTVRFTGLKPGRYAVAMHHDQNGNKDMDTYFFGLPKEGYGFSRDAPVFFGPPSFEEAAVIVPRQGLRISLEVQY